jgi:hypothetical protein
MARVRIRDVTIGRVYTHRREHTRWRCRNVYRHERRAMLESLDAPAGARVLVAFRDLQDRYTEEIA